MSYGTAHVQTASTCAVYLLSVAAVTRDVCHSVLLSFLPVLHVFFRLLFASAQCVALPLPLPYLNLPNPDVERALD